MEEAHAVALRADVLADQMARRQRQSLASQLRRAVEYQLQFVAEAKVLTPNEIDHLPEQVVEVRRMLYGLLKRLQ